MDDLDKDDLIRLFAYLQGELEARDIALATLRVGCFLMIYFQSEHINTANLRAKYGIVVNDRHSVRDLRDPFQALRRDSVSLIYTALVLSCAHLFAIMNLL